MAATEDRIEFAAKVPRELADRFKALYPSYGSVTWFIISALEFFVKESESDPAMVEKVRASISKMVEENRDFGIFMREVKKIVY